MTDLVWVIDSGKSSSFGSKGISGSYIIPQAEIYVQPNSMAGKRLWIIMRSHEDRLLKLIKIKKVEQIIEGYYLNDYLIFPELIESFRITTGYSTASAYTVIALKHVDYGIFELEDHIREHICNVVINSIDRMLISPNQKLFTMINFPINTNSELQLARTALKAIISYLTLEQIWGSEFRTNLGAFANFAAALITYKLNIVPNDYVIEQLKLTDPIYVLTQEISNPSIQRPLRLHPIIDTDFIAIEPEKIHTRKFIASEGKSKNLDETLSKTEYAEKIHQEMLKDISQFLISRGITPYQSDSIDLMYNHNGRTYLFEIKSTNVSNILAQSAKGAFQIACYLNELKKDYNNIDCGLILHRIGDISMENYVSDILKQLRTIPMFYDPSKPWPNRISDFTL